jgi:PAS domain S-box-containing protein
MSVRHPTPPPFPFGLREPDAVAQLLADVVDHLAYPVFVKDHAFRWVVLNRAFCALTGFSRERMLGHTDHEFFPREQADFFRIKDEEVFTSGRTVEIVDEPITDAEGVLHVLHTTKAPVHNAQGEITHLVGVIHDVTALRQADAALREANERLEARVRERTLALEAAQVELMQRERLAVIGRLAGSIAHQIRNPLGSIKNAAYLIHLSLGRPTEGDVSKALAIIHEEVQRANQIITDLLEFSRVAEPTRRPVPALFVLEQTLGGFDFAPPLTLVRAYPDTLGTVVVDAAQVQRALVHLVRNAMQAMRDGGTLTVDARTEPGFVVVSVADTGVGIPEAVRARLFEPLVTTNPAALGLGLMTARVLIENQGGRLACVRSDAQGTVFEAHLPLAAPEASGAAQG